MPSQALEVIAVCQSDADRHQLAKLRKDWSSEESRLALPKCVSLGSGIQEKADLQAAMESALEHPDENIIVTFGYSESEVRRFMSDVLVPLQVVGKSRSRASQPRESKGGKQKQPSASLLGDTGNAPSVMFGEDAVSTLRKAALCLWTRQSMKVRLLEEGDLDAYFSLRYRVWRELDYISPERICDKSEWEVDFTDRSAIPIGMFHRIPNSPVETLVACGRLVSGSGKEDPHFRDMVIRQVEGKREQCDEPQLLANLDYPTELSSPFDILDSFPGFRGYYRDLTKRRVKSAEISRIIVDEKFRNQGLGEVVVDSLIDLARDKKFRVLFMACIERHKTFYERCGFAVVPDLVCDRFVNVNVPAIAMHRKVRKS